MHPRVSGWDACNIIWRHQQCRLSGKAQQAGWIRCAGRVTNWWYLMTYGGLLGAHLLTWATNTRDFAAPHVSTVGVNSAPWYYLYNPTGVPGVFWPVINVCNKTWLWNLSRFFVGNMLKIEQIPQRSISRPHSSCQRRRYVSWKLQCSHSIIKAIHNA